ncbi:MAG TPA: hypothetical protein VIT38_03610 [Allosphingosinicella sp.]|jgi:hypothetical protein
MELTVGATPPLEMMIDRLQPCLVPPLFGARAVSDLRALAGELPPARYLLFEHHLGAGAGRTDVSIGKMTAIPACLGVRTWVEHDGPVLLEYDLHDGPALAGIFATFSPRAPASETALRSLVDGLPGARSLRARRMIARAAAAQVEGESWITHLGVMLGRPGSPVRVNVGFHRAEALRAFVEALDPGAPVVASLDRLLGLFEDAGGIRIAAIDLVERLESRIGLECHFPVDDGTWEKLVAHLVAGALCTPEEGAAICRWPSEKDADAQAWPEPFHSLDLLLGPQSGGRLFRSINHLKLVAEADGAIRAKIYLAATYLRDGVAGSELAA